MEWYPQDAMQAYLHTLHLCKQSNQEGNKAIEPNCAELVSALAAGKRAKLMVEVSAAEIPTPLTVALGAAAKQTGGRLVCVLLHAEAEAARARLRGMGLLGAVEIVVCTENPTQVIEKYEGLDFAAIDCKVVGDHVKLYKALRLNPKGSTVVSYNNLTGHLNDPNFLDVLKLAGKNNGVESYVTLPLVGEFGRLGFSGNTNNTIASSSHDSNKNNNKSDGVCKGLNKVRSKKYRRFLVTFEN